MAKKVVAGLKSCFAGDVGVDGSAGSTLVQITQPYQGGVTISGTAPSMNKFFEENKAYPEISLPDVTSGGTEVTWEIMDFDDETLKFYFGDNARSGIPDGSYQGEKTFRFDSLAGWSLIIARLQYVATITGTMSASEPLRISVSGTVLAPKEGEMAIAIVQTPTDSGSDV